MHSYWSVTTKRSRSHKCSAARGPDMPLEGSVRRAVMRWLRLRVHPRRRPSGLYYIFIMTIRKSASQGPFNLKRPVHCALMQSVCSHRFSKLFISMAWMALPCGFCASLYAPWMQKRYSNSPLQLQAQCSAHPQQELSHSFSLYNFAFRENRCSPSSHEREGGVCGLKSCDKGSHMQYTSTQTYADIYKPRMKIALVCLGDICCIAPGYGKRV